MKNKRAYIYARISGVSLFLYLVISFFWSLDNYSASSVLGIMTILLAISYFTFGTICSFLITEK